MDNQPKPYWNAYVAGIGLGLVLLATFLLAGRGLGASGAMTRFTTFVTDKVTLGAAESNAYFKKYLPENKHPLDDFLVYMFVGIFIGGLFSGSAARRVRKEIVRGPRTTDRRRLFFAFLGGILSALGARLARGCTSGQALTGGATLAVGSWLFMISIFIGGFALAYFMRREWT